MVSVDVMVAAAARPTEQNLSALVASVPVVDDQVIAAEVDAAKSRVYSDEEQRSLADVAISLTDLTTLEGSDSPTKVADLARRAIHPDPADPDAPHTAAICVYGDLAWAAREVLGSNSPVELACVAGAFPAGRADIAVKLADVRYALSQGATEIDMVIDRGAFLDRNYVKVFDDIQRIVAECHGHGAVRVKVILENGELGGLAGVAAASWLALAAGADIIKTSTGKIATAATLPDVAVMLHAATQYEQLTGRAVGVKAAGGIRHAAEALDYLALVQALAGADWLTPARFRFGASSLLADLVQARHR